MKRVTGILALVLFAAVIHLHGETPGPENTVIDIIVTSQKYDHASPWQKGPIIRTRATGCVIEGKRIVTSSYAIANHVMLEVLKKGESRKYQARTEINDYHAGLAILSVADESFFRGLGAAELSTADRMIGRIARVYTWDSLGTIKEYTAELAKSSIRFYEPSCGVLMHQFSTSMNDGGKGEPVFVDGRLAGIATGLNGETKTLYALSAEVLRRALVDEKDGTYDGIPFFWIESVDMQGNGNLRDYFGMAEGDGGVLVTQVPSISSGAGIIRVNDIILTIDGRPIDDNGLYDSPYGKLYYFGLIQLNRFVGETVSMEILRERKKLRISFTLKPVPDRCCFMPLLSTGPMPRYVIFGGMVFQELSIGYLEAFGPEWRKRADKRLLYYYDNVRALSGDKGRDRVVILSRVLPGTVNRGYQQHNNLPLLKVNGTTIHNIPHLKHTLDALKQQRYVIFEFEGATTIVMDRDEALRGEQGLLRTYNIDAPFNIK